MTNSMSPEEIAEMSEDHQCSCKELEQLRADISEAYYLRDKAEGRFCTALGTIEQLHAAVKTAQELAATRLMEIERLQSNEREHIQEITELTQNRDDYKADYLRMHKMFMDLKYPDTVPAHEPKVGETFPAFMYCPTCGQLYTGRGGQDGYPMMLTCPNHHTWQDPRPVEGASRDEPLEQRSDLAKAVRLFIFAAKRDNWPVVTHGYFTRMEAALLDVTTEGASRDASSGSNAWADAKGGLPDNKL